MAHAQLLLGGHTAALLLLFVALGSGPVIGLTRRTSTEVVLIPVLGFALAACLLTTCAGFMALRIAVWVVLVPAAIASLAAAVLTWRMQLPRCRPGREAAVPAIAGVLGGVLALLPPLLRGTEGPFSFAIFDAWGYAA